MFLYVVLVSFERLVRCERALLQKLQALHRAQILMQMPMFFFYIYLFWLLLFATSGGFKDMDSSLVMESAVQFRFRPETIMWSYSTEHIQGAFYF